jgi:hypothetical protein
MAILVSGLPHVSAEDRILRNILWGLIFACALAIGINTLIFAKWFNKAKVL